ncbi:hypothetical protein FRC03_002178 [Tulasnella sp. 419]|nr:hypothetical protein FRC03_002178 [Tulasnella sp. 419]
MPEREGHTPHDADGNQIGTIVADDIVRSINISYRIYPMLKASSTPIIVTCMFGRT